MAFQITRRLGRKVEVWSLADRTDTAGCHPYSSETKCTISGGKNYYQEEGVNNKDLGSQDGALGNTGCNRWEQTGLSGTNWSFNVNMCNTFLILICSFSFTILLYFVLVCHIKSLTKYIELCSLKKVLNICFNLFLMFLVVLFLSHPSWNDLIVGAPFYFDRGALRGGAVYIFMNENGSFQSTCSMMLTGEAFSGFGTAVAAIGDVNQDGFQGVTFNLSFVSHLFGR